MYRTTSRTSPRLSPEEWLLPVAEKDWGDYNNLAFLEMGDDEIEDLGEAIRAELMRRAQ